MGQKPKPPYMHLLECRGIYARGFFRFRDEPGECYGVTRGFRIHRLDGGTAPFTENDLWERYGQLERITREDFEAARRARLGQPSDAGLAELAERFTAAYEAPDGESPWRELCACGEETIRRVLELAAERMEPEGGPKRQARYRALFREAALARAQRRR